MKKLNLKKVIALAGAAVALVALTIAATLIVTRPSPGPGSGGTGTAVSKTLGAAVEGSLGSKPIGSAGGVLSIAEAGSELDGLTVSVPAGAIKGDDMWLFSAARRADGTGNVAFASTTSLQDFADISLTDGQNVVHPLWATLMMQAINQAADPTPISPVVAFGPEGITFDTEVEVTIPVDSSLLPASDEAALVSVVIGDYKDGELSGSVIRDVKVDAEKGTVTFKTSHFSVAQVIKSYFDPLIEKGKKLKPYLDRIPAVFTRAQTDLPKVPNFTQSFAGKIACSGISPRIDVAKIPNPATLLWYLSTPVDAPLESDDPTGYQEALTLWEQRKILTRHEKNVEQWLMQQPVGSVKVEDLFAESYRRTNGDVLQALMLSHNVLRGFDGQNRLDGLGTPHAVQSAMAPITGGGRSRGDEIGDRYHLFGIAAFALTSRIYTTFTGRLPGGIYGAGSALDEPSVDMIVAFEECIISGDCLSDSTEFAVDMEGRDLGFEFANNILGDYEDGMIRGVDTANISEHFAVDDRRCLEVQITGKSDILSGENASLNATATGGVPPVGVEWRLKGKTVMTGPEFFYKFEKPGSYPVTAFARDGRRLKGFATITVEVRNAADYSGYQILRVTNYAGNGYLTIRQRKEIETPPLLGSFPGGGIGDTVAVWEPFVDTVFRTQEEAAKSLCGRFKRFYRPALASFIQEGRLDGDSDKDGYGIDGVFVSQCPNVKQGFD